MESLSIDLASDVDVYVAVYVVVDRKKIIGTMRGAWWVAVVWVLSCMESEGADQLVLTAHIRTH